MTEVSTTNYAVIRDLDEPFDSVVDRVRETLAGEGFGVLSEIDVQAAMREKIGEEVGEYLILGACNPQLAHRGLGVEPDLGVLLPCNVVVRANGDQTRVAAMEPLSAMQLAGNDDLQPIASEARERIERAVSAL
jgi:hypothetical protein